MSGRDGCADLVSPSAIKFALDSSAFPIFSLLEELRALGWVPTRQRVIHDEMGRAFDSRRGHSRRRSDSSMAYYPCVFLGLRPNLGVGASEYAAIAAGKDSIAPIGIYEVVVATEDEHLSDDEAAQPTKIHPADLKVEGEDDQGRRSDQTGALHFLELFAGRGSMMRAVGQHVPSIVVLAPEDTITHGDRRAH